MAKAGIREKIILACDVCKQRNYNSMKNKKNDPERLTMMKYCRNARKYLILSLTTNIVVSFKFDAYYDINQFKKVF